VSCFFVPIVPSHHRGIHQQSLRHSQDGAHLNYSYITQAIDKVVLEKSVEIALVSQ